MITKAIANSYFGVIAPATEIFCPEDYAHICFIGCPDGREVDDFAVVAIAVLYNNGVSKNFLREAPGVVGVGITRTSSPIALY